MKNAIYLLLAVGVLSAAGCGTQKEAAIEIGGVTFTKAEFDRAFEDSRFASVKEGKKAFLDSYINKKLLLLKAEAMGLDKNPAFLNRIQMFWETALLDSVLSKKSDELGGLANISEAEVRDYYEKNKDRFFADKDLDSAREQIRWFIIQGKQSGAMGVWLKELRDETPIKVDYERLDMTE